MDEERIRVLNMVKDGKLTVDEATKLLEAMNATPEKDLREVHTKAKWLRVKVTDLSTGKPKVAVNLPIVIVDWALKMGPRAASLGGVDLNSMGVDLEELRSVISYGMRGKIVDVTDNDSASHVEIVVE